MTKGLAASASSSLPSESSTQADLIRQLWLNTDCVCFDVDSTVCTEEAIDELAKFQQVGTLVEAITRNAMGGNMSFRTALQARLNLIQPTRQRLEQFLINHPSQLTDGISELINLLHERQIPVYLITGGFHAIVDPVAEQLNIPLTNVFANQILFNPDGSYASFDEDEMTSDSGGKGRVIEYLKNKYHYQRLIMIGDGATDMEANADGFIGFGGNVIREKVRDNASWFVNSFYELTDEFRNNKIDSISQTNLHHQHLTTKKYSTEIKAN
jgi:phosphoserine phosphatase